MKKLCLFLLLCFVVVPLATATTRDDGPIEVDWYPLFTDSVGWNIYSGGFLVGWVNAMNAPAPMDVAMGRSMELAWLNVVGAKLNTGHGQRITMGVGIDWRNYRLAGNQCFTLDREQEQLRVEACPEGATHLLSRVKVFSLTVPVLLRQRLFNKVDIFAGPVLNFNVHASMLTKYRLDGTEVKHVSNHIHPVPVTVDVMGGVKWSCLGAYVRYSPCHVLRQAHAPAFTTLSAGIFLGF